MSFFSWENFHSYQHKLQPFVSFIDFILGVYFLYIKFYKFWYIIKLQNNMICICFDQVIQHLISKFLTEKKIFAFFMIRKATTHMTCVPQGTFEMWELFSCKKTCDHSHMTKMTENMNNWYNKQATEATGPLSFFHHPLHQMLGLFLIFFKLVSIYKGKYLEFWLSGWLLCFIFAY